MSTSNVRIKAIDPIDPPRILFMDYPISERVASLVEITRNTIGQILHQQDDRLLVIVGPCSVHDTESAMEYAGRLAKVRAEHLQDLEIVMRVYFEKPRSTVGWKGLINDPDLDQSFKVNKGLRLARELLLEVNQLGLPAGTEFLDAVTGQYYADLISWGAIGARTTESQVHRELASGLSCPVGFKNATNGDLGIAIDAVVAARSPHIFLSPTEIGQTAMFTTAGNQDTHIILRGGKQPNYGEKDISSAQRELSSRSLDTGLMIDFSHANSLKQFERQMLVGSDVTQQIANGNTSIVGCMIESHLVEGNQSIKSGTNLNYGQSITDACLGWEDTERLLAELAEGVRTRRLN